MTTPAIWFAEAQQHQQAQRLAEAEALYRRVVAAEPAHSGAWYQLGQLSLAQDHLRAAADAYQCVLALVPSQVEALTQLGIVLARQKQLPAAIAKFHQALQLRPQHAPAHNNLGVALNQCGRQDEALACYQQALRWQPDYPEAALNLAAALLERRQPAEAIAVYERAWQLRPTAVEILSNLGHLLAQERRPAEGVICLQQAVRLCPTQPDYHNNLALALADLGRFEEAVASCDAALRLNPLDPKPHLNRANALTSAGRLEEAVAGYALALRLDPSYANARWNRSVTWLTQGDFERGWPEYEWRWQRSETRTRTFPRPRWDGSPPQGRTILLWCEQGLGDMLQFVRYAPLVKERGGTVWLECPAKLLPLFSTCPGIDRLFAEGTPVPTTFDYQIPLLSLPGLFQTTLATIPTPIPYLAAAPELVAQWRQELHGTPGLKIGIAWQGNPQHRLDRHRSFPLHWFAGLAELEAVTLYSLQKGPGSEQLASCRFPLVDLGSRLDQSGGAFQETAAVLQSLDLVISCDSALAHLAGALGVRVWVPLATAADWRWLRDREDSPWYPSLRLFRQRQLGDWAPVFERLRTAVVALRDERNTSLRVPVAPGELLDKLTILEIKAERLQHPEQLQNVRTELALLSAVRRERLCEPPGMAGLVQELKQINERLWDVENRLRECEQAEDFGPEFIALARAVYKANDRRSALKRRLNQLLGASFCEEKDYSGSTTSTSP